MFYTKLTLLPKNDHAKNDSLFKVTSFAHQIFANNLYTNLMILNINIARRVECPTARCCINRQQCKALAARISSQDIRGGENIEIRDSGTICATATPQPIVELCPPDKLSSFYIAPNSVGTFEKNETRGRAR